MEYRVVDDNYDYQEPAKASATPRLHAVTPNVNLKEWDGVPPYAVAAFIGYLLVLAVLFSDQAVPYCQANFAQPQNCAPLFGKVFPVIIGAILLAPALGGAVRRMGGDKATALIFSFCVTVVPPLILGLIVLG
ncbi:MAG: hypothetical protein JXJ18_03120 [Rhodobacteraceae bacterium]|nr:hypothetical protein [Paracoccaceae bacterium]